MDNLIQVIIVLFIIWSFFGSVKKKKEQNAKRPNEDFSKEDLKNNSKSPRQTSIDVLDEILGFKIPRNQSPFPAENDYESVDIEKTVPDLETNINYDKQSSLELTTAQVAISEINNEYNKTVMQNKSARSVYIKEYIKKPVSLREIILFSEILNKPKALRK